MQTQHLRPIFLLEEDYSKSPITILQSSIKVTDKTPEGGLRRHPAFFCLILSKSYEVVQCFHN